MSNDSHVVYENGAFEKMDGSFHVVQNHGSMKREEPRTYLQVLYHVDDEQQVVNITVYAKSKSLLEYIMSVTSHIRGRMGGESLTRPSGDFQGSSCVFMCSIIWFYYCFSVPVMRERVKGCRQFDEDPDVHVCA